MAGNGPGGIDAIRAAHLDGRPDSTHWGDCHLAHPHCAIAVLLTEVERLRDGIRQHRDSYPPYAGKPEERLWALLDDR